MSATGHLHLDNTGDRWRLVYPAGTPFVTIGLNATRPRPTIKACQLPVKIASDFPDEGNLREIGGSPLGAVGNVPKEVGPDSLLHIHRPAPESRPMSSGLTRSCQLFKARSRIRNRLPRPAHLATM